MEQELFSILLVCGGGAFCGVIAAVLFRGARQPYSDTVVWSFVGATSIAVGTVAVGGAVESIRRYGFDPLRFIHGSIGPAFVAMFFVPITCGVPAILSGLATQFLIRSMRYRLRTLLIVAGLLPIPLAALSANFLTLPLRDSDKVDAARSLIAWVVEDRPVPGFNQPVADGKWIRKRESLVVGCGFVPASTRLSDDSRVRPVSRQEFDWYLKNPDFPSTAYIELVLKSESPRLLVLELSNYHGSLGAQSYRFEFRRKVWGLRGWGKLLWVS